MTDTNSENQNGWQGFVLIWLLTAICVVIAVSRVISASPVVFIRPSSRPDLPPATGVVIGVNDRNEGVVLTSGHILKLGKALVGDGKTWRPSTVIGRDDASDLAALLIEWNGSASSLSDAEGPFGQPVWAWGATSAYIRGQTLPSPTGTVSIDHRSQKGDSGAPLFNQNQKLLGILCGGYADTDQQGRSVHREVFYGPNAATIRRDLKYWGWECKDGRCRRIGIQQPAWTPIPQSSQGAAAGRVGDTAAAPAPLQGPPGKSIVGPQGRPGTPGQDGKSIIGPQGIPGRPGNDAVLDLSKIPPITIELMGADGKVAQRFIVHPGGTLQLPPITMTTIGADGTRHSRVRPLGGEFRLGFFEQER